MLSIQELMKVSKDELATLCQKISENPSAYSTAGADGASKLYSEWLGLQTSSDPDNQQEQQIEGKRMDLKKRMAEFLAGIL